MFALIALIAAYVVHLIALPLDRLPAALVSTPDSAEVNFDACGSKAVAISSNNVLAIILLNGAHKSNIIRLFRMPAANHDDLSLPPASVLAHGFALLGASNLSSAQLRSSAEFEQISAPDDDHIIAVIGSYFSGAFSGKYEAPFVYDLETKTWSPLSFTNVLAAQNVTLGGAISLRKFALNGNYQNLPLDVGAAEDNSFYRVLESELVSGKRSISLGAGIATGMRGSYISGYDAGLSALAPASPPETNAVVWHGTIRTSLGTGLACDVDASGKAIGSNERLLGTDGYPTEWSVGHEQNLSRQTGIAYSINSTGQIVGTAGNRAFLTAGGSAATKRLHFLDDLISDHSWHLSSAFLINDQGTIIAVGNRDGTTSLVELNQK